MRAGPLLLFLLAACGGRTPAKLQGYDLLAAEGGGVLLRAKLEKRGIWGIHPDVHGEELFFRLDGRLLGSARTKDEGIASLDWTPPAGKGVHEIAVSLAPSSRYEAAALPFRVFVRDPRRPGLVVDIDGTICAAPQKEVATRPPAELPAVEGAAEALVALAAGFDVVYLTARDDALMGATREWLGLRGFPEGPVLVRDLGVSTLSAERYKRERLKTLRKTWNLVAGVGDREEDGEAYLAAGLEAYLIGDVDDVPRGARKLVRWSEILTLLR